MVQPGLAIVLLHSDDPFTNTTEPTSEFQHSGWRFQGDWGRFLGTAISRNLFITAAHVGGALGDFFVYQGQRYECIARFPHPDADLQIVKVADEFPNHAAIYEDSSEIGSTAVYFGRGARRGDPVTNATDTRLRGWRWGATEAARRWGVNRIEETLEITTSRGPQQSLRAGFDLDGPEFECHLSDGDSGGGLFIQSLTGWRLAGVNVSVSGPYKISETSDPFNAALFSEDGFWISNGEDEWSLNEISDHLRPGSLYSARVSQYQDWIQSLIDTHQSTHHRIALLGSERPDGFFAEVTATTTTDDAGDIEFPIPTTQGFYVLKSRRPARFAQVIATADALRFRFEFLDASR